LVKFIGKFGTYLKLNFNKNLLHDSAFGIATGYELDDRGSISGRGNKFFSTPKLPDRIWGPTKLLSNGYLKLQEREADHFHLMQRLRMEELYPDFRAG
jgi:hypothetical protein